jgi:ABC-type multidrug transport system ATPase subunit
VRETLAVVARLRGISAGAVDRELDSCGLAALADRGVGHLSGGERQRLAMAVAFLPMVGVYLFDEPSANLDPAASRLLFQRARQLKRDGHTLLFTTHIPADVRRSRSRRECSGSMYGVGDVHELWQLQRLPGDADRRDRHGNGQLRRVRRRSSSDEPRTVRDIPFAEADEPQRRAAELRSVLQ